MKIQGEKQYFEYLMQFIPLAPFWQAVCISVASMVVFLFLSAHDISNVLRSNFFVIQLNFSITIFIGIWLGNIAVRDFRLIVNHMRHIFVFKGSARIEAKINKLWVSLSGQLFSLPFMISALFIAVFFANEMQLFLSQYRYPLLYLYLVVFQGCILVTNLLGATAYWIMFCLTLLFREYSNATRVNFCLADLTKLKKAEVTVRKLSFFLLIIILSLLPSILVIAFHLPEKPARFFSFFFPTWFLNKLIRKTRECREVILDKRIFFWEAKLFTSTQKDKLSENYLLSLAACREELRNLRQEAAGSFSASVVLELLLAGLVSPAATLIFQRIVFK